MNKIQKNAAISIAVTGLFTGLAWAVHATDGDPLLFWLALALTIIANIYSIT